MGSLQKILDDKLKMVPEILLRGVINEKLARVGLNLEESVIHALIRHVIEKKEGNFTWDNELEGDDDDIILSFDEDDYRKLNALSQEMIERLEKLPLELTELAVKPIFDDLIANWDQEKTLQKREQDNFRCRLDNLWGKGLDLFRMFLTCTRDLMGMIIARTDKAVLATAKFLVLTRLYARGCQVTEEVIVLLENGLADGAMARWRTLHEISVVALLISDGDEDLAQRYYDHDVVDEKKLSENYLIDRVELGFTTISENQVKYIQQKYLLSLETYGQDFRHQYGWAAKSLGIKKPNFSQLQHAAGRSAMSAYYRFASDNIHAGSRGTFIRMSAMGKSDTFIAGRSNAGFLEPAQNTVYSMTQIVASLFGTPKNLDEMVEMSVMIELREATKISFLEASKNFERRVQDHKQSKIK